MNFSTLSYRCLFLVWMGMLVGCASSHPDLPCIVTATNNGAKFRRSALLTSGKTMQWKGSVDGKGFARGHGTQVTLTSEGKIRSELEAQFFDGVETAGEFELRIYNAAGDAIVERQMGRKDAQGRLQGEIVLALMNVIRDHDPVGYQMTYVDGKKEGDTVVFYKNGDRAFYMYRNEVPYYRHTVRKDGTKENLGTSGIGDLIAERQRKLREGVVDFERRTALEKAAQREQNSAALLGGVAQGLTGMAALQGQSTGPQSLNRSMASSSSSSYPNSSGASGGRSAQHGSRTTSAAREPQNGKASYRDSKTPPITLTRSKTPTNGTVFDGKLTDSRGFSHHISAGWGKGYRYKTPEEAKAGALREARESVNAANARYAEEDREKAERLRRYNEQQEKMKAARNAKPQPESQSTSREVRAIAR